MTDIKKLKKDLSETRKAKREARAARLQKATENGQARAAAQALGLRLGRAKEWDGAAADELLAQLVRERRTSEEADTFEDAEAKMGEREDKLAARIVKAERRAKRGRSG